VHTLRYLLQKTGSDLVVGWILGEIDGNEELLGLFVNITNIDTA
jgi:hypothetical protein